MARTQTSLGQHLPCYCDDVVNLVDGISIKGAAVRRQQAIEHALLIEKASIKMDRKTDTAESSIQNLALPVPDGRKRKEKDKEITNGVSSINNQDVNAEIASVSELFNTLRPTLDHRRLPHCHPSETAETVGRSDTCRASSSSMPPFLSVEQSRKNGKGKSLLHISLLCAVFVSVNPRRPCSSTGSLGIRYLELQHPTSRLAIRSDAMDPPLATACPPTDSALRLLSIPIHLCSTSTDLAF